MSKLLPLVALLLLFAWSYIYLIEEQKMESSSVLPEQQKGTHNSTYVVKTKYKEYEVIEQNEEEEQLDLEKHYEKKTEDYLGSISIPAIGTSDAVYRSEGEFYLRRDFNKESYEPGEIYLDDRTTENLTDSGALLNGHHVPDGSKFGSFKKLLDIDEQPEVLIWDEKLQKLVKYEMLFVSLIDGGTSGIIMNFKNEGQRLQYYRNLHATSIKKWEAPVPGDEFILLNSCSYIIESGHYVVVAKKVE